MLWGCSLFLPRRATTDVCPSECVSGGAQLIGNWQSVSEIYRWGLYVDFSRLFRNNNDLKAVRRRRCLVVSGPTRFLTERRIDNSPRNKSSVGSLIRTTKTFS